MSAFNGGSALPTSRMCRAVRCVRSCDGAATSGYGYACSQTPLRRLRTGIQLECDGIQLWRRVLITDIMTSFRKSGDGRPFSHQSATHPAAPCATVLRYTSPLVVITHRPPLKAASVTSTGPTIFCRFEEILNRTLSRCSRIRRTYLGAFL